MTELQQTEGLSPEISDWLGTKHNKCGGFSRDKTDPFFY